MNNGELRRETAALETDDQKRRHPTSKRQTEGLPKETLKVFTSDTICHYVSCITPQVGLATQPPPSKCEHFSILLNLGLHNSIQYVWNGNYV